MQKKPGLLRTSTSFSHMTVWVKVRQAARPHPRVEKETPPLNGRDRCHRAKEGRGERRGIGSPVVSNILGPRTQSFVEDSFSINREGGMV